MFDFQLSDSFIDSLEFDQEELTARDRRAREKKASAPGLIGIRRQRWAFRHGIGFFAIRSFTTEKKKREIETLKQIKRDRPKKETRLMSQEITQALINTFVDLSAFTVTSAPAHKTGFGVHLGQLVAESLCCQYKELFTTKKEENARRVIFGDRPAIQLKNKIPNRGLIWVDDTITTGRTLEGCRDLVKGIPFIPVIWIYDDARGFE